MPMQTEATSANDDGDMKAMLTLAVGCFAQKLNEPGISEVAKAHYTKAYDLASKMLDKYWRPSSLKPPLDPISDLAGFTCILFRLAVVLCVVSILVVAMVKAVFRG